jgi:hypothetical protein
VLSVVDSRRSSRLYFCFIFVCIVFLASSPIPWQSTACTTCPDLSISSIICTFLGSISCVHTSLINTNANTRIELEVDQLSYHVKELQQSFIRQLERQMELLSNIDDLEIQPCSEQTINRVQTVMNGLLTVFIKDVCSHEIDPKKVISLCNDWNQVSISSLKCWRLRLKSLLASCKSVVNESSCSFNCFILQYLYNLPFKKSSYICLGLEPCYQSSNDFFF